MEVYISNVRNEKEDINFRATDMRRKKREDIMNNFMIKYLKVETECMNSYKNTTFQNGYKK